MPRPILDETHTHPAIRSKVAAHHEAMLQEVIGALGGNDVVVVRNRTEPLPQEGLQGAGRYCSAIQISEIRQLFQSLAQTQCIQNVDWLADISDGVRQKNIDWWGPRLTGVD